MNREDTASLLLAQHSDQLSLTKMLEERKPLRRPLTASYEEPLRFGQFPEELIRRKLPQHSERVRVKVL